LRLAQLSKNQREVAEAVRIVPLKKRVSMIAGADVARNGKYLFGSMAVLSFPELLLLDESHAEQREPIPYVPGFLSYRELPVLAKAFSRLKKKPDLILVDGQGIAHPRRLGLASHLGVVLGVPTIGCAKSHLYGDYEMPEDARGSYTFLKSKNNRIGLVLRTRNNVKPLFISPGHLIDLDGCLCILLSVTPRYRIPEPIRQAHRMAGSRARSA